MHAVALLQVIALYTSPQAFDANARDRTTISGICDNPQALKRLAKDTLTALDHLHKYVVALLCCSVALSSLGIRHWAGVSVAGPTVVGLSTYLVDTSKS
jgi:hypothetical protein